MRYKLNISLTALPAEGEENTGISTIAVEHNIECEPISSQNELLETATAWLAANNAEIMGDVPEKADLDNDY